MRRTGVTLAAAVVAGAGAVPVLWVGTATAGSCVPVTISHSSAKSPTLSMSPNPVSATVGQCVDFSNTTKSDVKVTVGGTTYSVPAGGSNSSYSPSSAGAHTAVAHGTFTVLGVTLSNIAATGSDVIDATAPKSSSGGGSGGGSGKGGGGGSGGSGGSGKGGSGGSGSNPVVAGSPSHHHGGKSGSGHNASSGGSATMPSQTYGYSPSHLSLPPIPSLSEAGPQSETGLNPLVAPNATPTPGATGANGQPLPPSPNAENIADAAATLGNGGAPGSLFAVLGGVLLFAAAVGAALVRRGGGSLGIPAFAAALGRVPVLGRLRLPRVGVLHRLRPHRGAVDSSDEARHRA